MTHRMFLIVCFILSSFVCHAQTEHNDSVELGHKLNGDTTALKFIGRESAPEHYNLSLQYHPAEDPLFCYRMFQPLELNIPELSFSPGQATLYSWRTGEVIATGGMAVYPGLMQIDSGSIGLYQREGNFTFYAGGMANKYGYFRGLHTQYGLNGSISYSFSPKVSFTAFGTYYFGKPPIFAGNLPMPPAMVGYYGVSRFGGYVNYNVGERFGVMVGVQTVQQIGTHRYEPEPIVTPYFKIGSGSKKIMIGLPVGQILYHIIRH